ncbi:hypothetical protein BH10PSE19_BH10PSE19_09510 [soil metagenome]
MLKQPACLIVDPFVSPSIFCRALLDENIAPIAILTNTWSDMAWKMERMQGSHFTKIIECYTEQQRAQLLDQLVEYEILACLYGSDGKTVANTDWITKHFFPQFANDDDSNIRMDKYAMHEACKIHGIQSAQQLRIKSPHLTENEWAFVNSLLPVVVKPAESFCSQGVSICCTATEVQAALIELLGTVYASTGAVNEVIIQEQLQGTEYFVDTVSISGHHYPCAVFRYRKITYKNHNIARYFELVDHRSIEGRSCIEYVLKVLDAVGRDHGLAHTEVFLTPTGPCLVEVNPRVSGAFGTANQVAKFVYGINQVEFFAKVLKQPNLMAPAIADEYPGCGVVICLQNWTSRRIGALNKAALQTFASYCASLQMIPAGTLMNEPQSALDGVGFVVLYHKSAKQLDNDIEAILKLEEAGKLF